MNGENEKSGGKSTQLKAADLMQCGVTKLATAFFRSAFRTFCDKHGHFVTSPQTHRDWNYAQILS